jgi:hypothetical protein
MKLILILTLTLLCSLMFTVANSDYDFKPNELVNIYNITRCEGPVKINVISIEDDSSTLRFNSCRRNSEGVFDCQCNDAFNINFIDTTTTKRKYAIVIEYFIQYNNSTANQLNNYKRTVRIDNVLITPPETLKDKIDFTIEPVKILLAVISFIIILIIFLVFKYKNKFLNESGMDDDMFNYAVNDKELERLLKDKK